MAPSKETREVSPAARAALEKGRRLTSKREYAKAAEEFQEAQRLGGGGEALSGEALCLYKMGRLREALQAAASAVAAAPGAGEPHFISGLVFKEAGSYDEAVDALNLAEQFGYRRAAVLYHRAAAHFLAGRLAQAEGDLAEASRLEPKSAAIFHNLAVVRIHRTRWREAAQAFMRCAQLDPAGLPRYQELVFEIGRAQANEEFHFRGHRIKNMLALLTDTCRRTLEGGAPALAAATLAPVADRLEKIFAEMSELLMFVKREPLELDVWGVSDVIESALVSAGDALAAVRVERAYAPDLPDIVCDAHALGEVFLNIILNAAEAMPQGGALFVRTGGDAQGRVRIEFEDTGGGIKVDPPSKIFRFAFTTKPNGTGLGLCQATRTVHEHDGTIAVEDGARGARFVITLPFSPRVGESMQDIGLRADLSEDSSGLGVSADSGDTARSGMGSR